MCVVLVRQYKVTPYGWASLPSPHFLHDDNLISDKVAKESAAAAAEKEGRQDAGGNKGGKTAALGATADDDDDGDMYTVYLTTKPTRQPWCNEIDVSSIPDGVCLVRLIYPTDSEVARCRPIVQAVPAGERKRLK